MKMIKEPKLQEMLLSEHLQVSMIIQPPTDHPLKGKYKFLNIKRERTEHVKKSGRP